MSTICFLEEYCTHVRFHLWWSGGRCCCGRWTTTAVWTTTRRGAETRMPQHLHTKRKEEPGLTTATKKTSSFLGFHRRFSKVESCTLVSASDCSDLINLKKMKCNFEQIRSSIFIFPGHSQFLQHFRSNSRWSRSLAISPAIPFALKYLLQNFIPLIPSSLLHHFFLFIPFLVILSRSFIPCQSYLVSHSSSSFLAIHSSSFLPRNYLLVIFSL